MTNRTTAQLIGAALLGGVYLWLGATHGWLSWHAIAVAVLLLLNVLSAITTKGPQ